ncbi:hypothetical protein PO909_008855, partial [Leuciscus waleckii]
SLSRAHLKSEGTAVTISVESLSEKRKDFTPIFIAICSGANHPSLFRKPLSYKTALDQLNPLRQSPVKKRCRSSPNCPHFLNNPQATSVQLMCLLYKSI